MAPNLKGGWTTEWVNQFGKYLPDKREEHAITLMSSILNTVLQLWQIRCDTQHEDTQQTDTNNRNQLIPQIRALYAIGPRLDAIDQSLKRLAQTHRSLH
jgi:hypothetical protein